jgi:hypothetical protein
LPNDGMVICNQYIDFFSHVLEQIALWFDFDGPRISRAEQGNLE